MAAERIKMPRSTPLTVRTAQSSGHWPRGANSPGQVDNASALLDQAIAALEDRELAIEDRAALYAILHALQLRVTRALRMPGAELKAHMSATGSMALGPLRLKAGPATFPCNDPGNWDDAGVQDALRAMAGDPHTAPYVRHVPEHFELDTAALRDGQHDGDPNARLLYRELNARGWRVPGDPAASLQVAEVKP
jgi:hypothetical protein